MIIAFHVGRESRLSIREIESVLTVRDISFTQTFFQGSFVIYDIASSIVAAELMSVLGGTIAILEAVPLSRPITTQEDIPEVLASYLDTIVPEGKIVFSFHNGDRTGLVIKKTIQQLFDRSCRFVVPKNSATIIHNHLVEKQTDLYVINNMLFVTRAVQPIDEFAHRDYGRPEADSRSGMLPPKLARMLLNISGVRPAQHTILDPFCGSGTVLMEAALLGFSSVYGSDAAQKAVNDSKQNSAWLFAEGMVSHSDCTITIMQSDARSIHTRIPKESIDVIVSEPYMGKPLHGKESRYEIDHQVQELSRLYEEAFRSFLSVLKPGGVVVFVIPQFFYRDEWIMIDCLRAIELLGFQLKPLDTNSPSLLYWRKGQHVGRGIYTFIKHT